MSDFTFSATTQCDLCGTYLSSSDETCDHNGKTISVHLFRRLREGRDSLIGVESAPSQKWNLLEEKVGDDWIAYQYIGTRSTVTSMLSGGHTWNTIEELPLIEMSIHASKD